MKPVQTVPAITVELDGTPLAAGLAASLSEVRVRQRLSLPAQCELTFQEPEGEALPGSPGESLCVRAAGFDLPLFTGEVTARELRYEPSCGRVLRLRAYDLLHRLRKRHSVRAHVEVTFADLARELAAGLGVSVDAPETGPLRKRIVQFCQSDLELLQETAERCGLYFTLREDVLHVLTLQGMGEAVPLALRDALLEARLELNGDPACRSVAVRGWDPMLAEAHKGQAGVPRSGRQIEAEACPSSFGASGERFCVDAAFQDDRQAEALAQAELDAAAAREATLWGVASGDPRLRPGTPVEVSGVAAPFEGRYVLTEVEHRVDARHGYVSELSSDPPARRLAARAASAALGVVRRVDDPDRLGRVLVSFPALADVETDWLQVVCPGAGGKKGVVALPDVGDSVLVLFVGGDPVQGVVLGGLYGAGGPPDAGVERGAVKRYTMTTPGGQRLRLDDEKCLVRLEDAQGSYVEFSPDGFRVHSAVDLTIEAPGRAVVIRGASVDFKKA